MSGLLTVKEVAQQFGVGHKTVQRWIKAERLIPTLTLPGQTGAHLFDPADAERAFGGGPLPRGPWQSQRTAPMIPSPAPRVINFEGLWACFKKAILTDPDYMIEMAKDGYLAVQQQA